MSKSAKILTAIGSGLLILTAGFHSTALPQASDAAKSDTAHPLVAMTFEGIWLMPTISWCFIALLSLVIAFGKVFPKRLVLSILAAIPLAHAGAILIYTGPFIGAYMLLAAGGFLILGSQLYRRSASA